MKNLIAPLTLFVIFVLSSCSKTWFVDSTYQGVSTGTSSQPYTSISAAVTAANKGDTIWVAPGMYQENVVLKNDIFLLSEMLGRAIIDGKADMGGGNPSIVGANAAVVDGFTITGGYDGIQCDGTSPTIRHCVIRSNYGDGGIVCLNGSSAVIENNTILGNLGSDYNRRPVGVYTEQSNPIIRNNIVTGNYFGISPYLSTPTRSYNNVWGNRVNYGYNATAGTGSISSDPEFVDVPSNDHRLGASSPCINTGNPGAAFNDDDGSRNDIGAFRKGNQTATPSSYQLQEFFLETVLRCHEDTSGNDCAGLSRFVQDPVFYFKNGASSVGARQIKTLLQTLIPAVSDGKLKAQFISNLSPSTNTCQIVTIEFVAGGGRGQAYFSGASCTDGTAQQRLQRSGAPIVGGFLDLPDTVRLVGIEGVANLANRRVFLHELEHVLGLAHSYRGKQHMITQLNDARPNEYSAVELEALRATYNYTPGHSLAQFKASDFITEDVFYPFPQIDDLSRLDNGGSPRPFDTIAVGDFLILEGSRFSLKYSCDERIAFRPADYQAPIVNFNGIEVTADLMNQTNYVGTPCTFLKVQVPAGATSGYIFLRRRESESNPVYLEVK